MFLSSYPKLAKKEEKKILLVSNSYLYWCDVLFEKCIRIFKYNNLPFPQKEIEMRTLAEGYCGFVNDEKAGIMVASGGMSGPTQYWDEFKNFKYDAPTAKGGTKEIHKNCVIINNNALRNSLIPLIRRYASLLAHSEATLKCSLVNERYTDVFTTSDNGVAENVNEFYNKIYEGETRTIIDDSMIDSISNKANPTHSSAIKDCIDARNDILRSFYNEIGVRYTKDKKERMVSDEVSNDDQMLLFNIHDMLFQRQQACEEINKIFDLNISVELSPEFNVIEQEKEDNKEPENKEQEKGVE